MPHECPECLTECHCEPGEADIRDCAHDPCDLPDEGDFSDDEAQYNYED